MKFKDNLRKQRNLAHLSQESLADQMSVSRQTISKWENGDTYPSTKHIFMLAKILKCDFGSLVSLGSNHDADNPTSQASNYQTNNQTSPKPNHTASSQTNPESPNDKNAEIPTSQRPVPIRKKYLYWLTGTITAIFIVTLGLDLSICLNSAKQNSAEQNPADSNQSSTINNSKLLVFDKILDGSLDDAMSTFTRDGYADHQIIGYGITEGETFYVKCSLNNDRGNPCSAIIYFCANDGDYPYECQYLDDPNFVPKGEYYELGVI